MLNVPRYIGLHGALASGKDTVALILQQLCGGEIVGLADSVKFVIGYLFPSQLGYSPTSTEYKSERFPCMTEDGIVYRSGRELFQKMGTEAGRNVIGQDVWVNRLKYTMDTEYPEGTTFIIKDVRFDSEAKRIKEFGGLIVKIAVRPDVYTARVARLYPGITRDELDHASEKGVSDYLIDRVIDNSGTVEELEERVSQFAKINHWVKTLQSV